MGSKKSIQSEELAKWLEILCDDSYTRGEALFHVDVFETDSDYIIEAILPRYKKSQISVKCENNKILIQAENDDGTCKERTLQWPFSLVNREIRAFFENDILEVKISKTATTDFGAKWVEIN